MLIGLSQLTLIATLTKLGSQLLPQFQFDLECMNSSLTATTKEWKWQIIIKN